jgi:cobalamin biosynthesis protein CobD/CbiB
MFRHYIAIFRERSECLLRDAQLRISRENIVDGRVVFSDVVRGDLRSAPQLRISQKALETLAENGNAMPKHVGATIHN